MKKRVTSDWISDLGPYANHPLVIDTNLLLLLMVGQTDQAAIRRSGRTENFKDEDFDNVTKIAEFFAARKGLSTTPHVLAEVSICWAAGSCSDRHSVL